MSEIIVDNTPSSIEPDQTNATSLHTIVLTEPEEAFVKATITNHYNHGSFIVYEISIQYNLQRWTLLRRYTWFKYVMDELSSENITLQCEFPGSSLWAKLMESETPEYAKGLQTFLDALLKNRDTLKKTYVQAFLLPIRHLCLLQDTRLNVKTLLYTNLYFMDPWLEGETDDPKLFNEESEIIPLTQLIGSRNLVNLTAIPPGQEVTELRTAILRYRTYKTKTPIESLLHMAYLKRLRLFNSSSTTKDSALNEDEPAQIF